MYTSCMNDMKELSQSTRQYKKGAAKEAEPISEAFSAGFYAVSTTPYLAEQ